MSLSIVCNCIPCTTITTLIVLIIRWLIMFILFVFQLLPLSPSAGSREKQNIGRTSPSPACPSRDPQSPPTNGRATVWKTDPDNFHLRQLRVRIPIIRLSLKKISLAEFKVLFISIYVKNHKMAHHLFCRWRCVTEDGALSLFNISREMSGFFICTSTNRIDSAKCNLTLAVMPGECLTWITCQTISDDPSHNYCTTSKYKMAKEALKSGLATVMRINHVSSPFHPVSMNMGATAGIIGGVLAGLLILGIVIYCCCCKKKGKEDKYAEEYVLLVRYVLSITSVYWLCPSGTLTQ